MKTRNELLSSLPTVEAVDSFTWDRVYVRQLRGNEFGELWNILELDCKPGERLARFTALGCCDQHGTRIFEADDYRVLLDGPIEPLAEVATAFLRINGVEEKKSDSAPTSDSSTLSAKSSEFSTPLQLSNRFPPPL